MSRQGGATVSTNGRSRRERPAKEQLAREAVTAALVWSIARLGRKNPQSADCDVDALLCCPRAPPFGTFQGPAGYRSVGGHKNERRESSRPSSIHKPSGRFAAQDRQRRLRRLRERGENGSCAGAEAPTVVREGRVSYEPAASSRFCSSVTRCDAVRPHGRLSSDGGCGDKRGHITSRPKQRLVEDIGIVSGDPTG